MLICTKTRHRLGRTVVRTLQSGFTLVEMVVVILIIGVLLGIAIPAYQYYNKAAWNASVAAEAQEIMTGYLAACATTANTGTLSTANAAADYLVAASTTPFGGGAWVLDSTTVAGKLTATAGNGLILTFTPPSGACSNSPGGSTYAVTPAVGSNPVFTNTLPNISVNTQGGVVYTPGN